MPSKKLVKPRFKLVRRLDYHECEKYINAKYNIECRDYAKHFKMDYKKEKVLDINEEQPYLDFWHWICETQDVHNGCEICLDLTDNGIEDAWIPQEMRKYNDGEWIKEILRLWQKEFGKKNVVFWAWW